MRTPHVVVPFPVGRARPVKAQLRSAVRASVAQAIRELPSLGRRNPKAALLAGKLIHKWNHAPVDNGLESQADVQATAADRVKAWERQRQLAAAHNRKMGNLRVAAWLEAHPHMSPAVNS